MGRKLLAVLLVLCPIALIAYACSHRQSPQLTVRKLLLLDERRYNRKGLPTTVCGDSMDVRLSFCPFSLGLERAVIKGNHTALALLFDEARSFSAYDPISVSLGQCLLLPEGFFIWGGDSLLYTAFANSDYQNH